MQVRYGAGISGVFMNLYNPIIYCNGRFSFMGQQRRKDKIRQWLLVDQNGFLMADANV